MEGEEERKNGGSTTCSQKGGGILRPFALFDSKATTNMVCGNQNLHGKSEIDENMI